MHAGQVISGAGHAALIGWLLLGGLFTPAREPFEMTEVSVISGAEYEALLAAQQPPASVSEVAQPAAPEVTPNETEISTETDAQITQPDPVPTAPPAEDPAPEVTEAVPPPRTPVEDIAPTLDEPIGDQAVLVPEVAPQPVARPVERVAPEPVAQPEPEVAPDPVQQEAVTPDAEGTPSEAETREATAPEDATTEIVTEDTTAPRASPRPPGRRPAAPEPAPAPTQQVEVPQEAPSEDDQAAAIAAAVAAAQGEVEVPSPTPAPTPAAPVGPPLSAGEKESLRVAVSACWNVGSLSSEALQTTVTLSVAMNVDGTPITGSITLESSEGGSSGAARQAFETARRAIIRCGARGYNLPAEKYGQWQSIEMTFNPERMRVK
ncbi:MAG: energy transducer TonB [Sulfitobacter sp.]|nr:energy transducer TonB [Sulfitobacter sp.]